MFWMAKPEEPKKSSIGSTLIKIILVLGSLAAIGTAAYLLIKKYKENMCTCCDCCDDDYDDLFCDDDECCCDCDDEECDCCCDDDAEECTCCNCEAEAAEEATEEAAEEATEEKPE